MYDVLNDPMVITIAKCKECKECTYPRVLPVDSVAPDIALPVVSISHHTQSLLHGNLSSAQRQQTRIILTVRGFPEFPECFHPQAPLLDCADGSWVSCRVRASFWGRVFTGVYADYPSHPGHSSQPPGYDYRYDRGEKEKSMPNEQYSVKKQRTLLCVVLDNDLPVEGFLTDG